jgi:N-acetylmuramoyl-L-alanine amidase
MFIRRRFHSLRAISPILCVLLLAALPARGDDAAARRAAAQAQFARAEALRAQLEAKTERERSIQDYQKLIDAYRRVYLITPHATEVPTALEEVGDLYRRMGEQFEPKYFDSAVEAYEFLLHEYPTSRFREEAQLAIAAIQRNNLGESNLAQKTYEDFLSQHPHSPHAEEARKALAELKASDALDAEEQAPASPPTATPPATDDQSAGNSEVGQVRVWNADTYTRIIIPLGGQAKYQAARISNPDRIYFDIEDAKISPTLSHEPIDVPSGGYLKSVRIAQNRANVVRVVLDVAQVKDYSVFELANPDRLVVDVYGPTADIVPTALVRAGKPVDAALPVRNGGKAMAGEPAADDPSRPATAQKPGRHAGAPSISLKKAVEALGPASVPMPTHAGEHSLTRALGLKVSRIVIDAGHGGHDTGTIGPTGLMEKDLCLDLALRLGKLIETRLPGAEVIYTRTDDTFVPLEQRTAVANNSKADLFLSIHANSSDDPKVRGIETYYLNFNASPAAMEVAARENALAQSGVHELRDLVQKIARNEKIEESRDFATDIQTSLVKQAQSIGHSRGVRQAPFVVLIGADMPSVLAEVSFLSNPADELWLKKPANREKIAEGLYHGIETYLHSTNSLALDARPSPAGQSLAVARSVDR